MPIRSPHDFQCPACGNNILSMEWEEIRAMLLTYNQINGSGTARELAKAVGVPDYSPCNWLYKGSEPKYDSGRKLGLYLKAKFQAMPDERINQFLKHHETALKAKHGALHQG